MITQMMADVVRCINQFPWNYGIFKTLSHTGINVGTGTQIIIACTSNLEGMTSL
jgi:hypothetical protein